MLFRPSPASPFVYVHKDSRVALAQNNENTPYKRKDGDDKCQGFLQRHFGKLLRTGCQTEMSGMIECKT